LKGTITRLGEFYFAFEYVFRTPPKPVPSPVEKGGGRGVTTSKKNQVSAGSG
jgi:hypothetical protein